MSMLPQFLKPNFWFVEFDTLDIKKDKNFIVFQILNFGGFEDWKWLFSNYSRDDIRHIIQTSIATAWFKQSLSLWQHIFDVQARPTRFSDISTPQGLWV